jgi:hypothetical protein
MRSIVVTVEADGSIRIDAVGFKGAACTKATEALEKALGKTTSRNKKPEYLAAVPTAAQTRQGGR